MYNFYDPVRATVCQHFHKNTSLIDHPSILFLSLCDEVFQKLRIAALSHFSLSVMKSFKNYE